MTGIPGTDGAEKAPRGVTPALLRCAAVAGMVLAGWLIGSGVSAADADLPEPPTSAPHAALLVDGDDLLDIEILPTSGTSAELPSDTPTEVAAPAELPRDPLPAVALIEPKPASPSLVTEVVQGPAPELVSDVAAPDVMKPVVQTIQEPVVNAVGPVLTAVVEPVREVVVEPVIATGLPGPADQPTASRATPDHLPSHSTDPLLAGSPTPLSTAPTVEVDEASAAAAPLSQVTSPADSFVATAAGAIDFSVPVSPLESAVVTSCSGASAPSSTGSKTTHGTSDDGYRAVPVLVAHRVQADSGDLPWSPNERPSTSPD